MTNAVPVIDLSAYFAGASDGKAAIAREVADTCETIGFLNRGAHGGPDHLPALLLRSRGGHPAHRARPGGRAAKALDEAGEVEHEDRLQRTRTRRSRRVISARPMSTVGRAPIRAASQPPGRPPMNVPIGNAAASTPAPVLVRPNSSTRSGSSGVIAA